mmetsp:Transcript_4035/g.8625  ORF Transcript_4035/g.8625 Transcript_4035/m.8625 type:complete len:375 (+) Transcript_4035:110-1234(+)
MEQQPPNGGEAQLAFQTVDEILVLMRKNAKKIDISWPESLREGAYGGLGSSPQLQKLMLRLSLHTADWLRRPLAVAREEDHELRLSYFPVQLLLAVAEGIRFALDSPPADGYSSRRELKLEIKKWQDDDPCQETSKAFLRELADFRSSITKLWVFGSLDLPALLPASGCLAESLDRLAVTLFVAEDSPPFSLSGMHTLTSEDIWGHDLPLCKPILEGRMQPAGLGKQCGKLTYFLAKAEHVKEFAGIVRRGARSSRASVSTGFALSWHVVAASDFGAATLDLCHHVEQLAQELDGVSVDIMVTVPGSVARSEVEVATRSAAALTSGRWLPRSLTVESPFIPKEFWRDDGYLPYWHVFIEQIPLGSVRPASLRLR